MSARDLATARNAAVRMLSSRYESARGWKIVKEKQSHKIDVIVALAMAVLGAVQQKGMGGSWSAMELLGRASRAARRRQSRR